MRTVVSVFLFLFLLTFSVILTSRSTAWAASGGSEGKEKESTELWSGSIYTSTFRCGFCFTKRGKARGVLLLKTAFGQVDEYHLYGTMKNGNLDVRHSSGHHVTGRIINADTVSGAITLGSGRKISFKGKRQKNAVLKKSDCAPLDE